MPYSRGNISRPLYETDSGRMYIMVDGEQIKVPWRYGKPYGIQCDNLKTIMEYEMGDLVEIWYGVRSGRKILERINFISQY
jgi:hypothetical protein